MRVSVVINTYNRSASLRTTLSALRQQTYADFEVVVVAGPCTDATPLVRAEWADAVRWIECPAVHLGQSRNLGIAAAAGEVVAFLDDDAIPDPHWLAELVAGYDTDCAGVGGWVYDYTGYQFQHACCVCDRQARPYFDARPPLWAYTRPHGDYFVHFLGTNASFRRTALVAVGGFDEEIEYYLDETDLCLRLTDAGFRLRPLAGAAVYHKFLASHLRNQQKVLKNPFPVVKNQFYVTLKALRPNESATAALAAGHEFVTARLQEAQRLADLGYLTPTEWAEFTAAVRRGQAEGIARAARPGRRLAQLPPAPTAAFRHFPRGPQPQHRLCWAVLARHEPTDWARATAAAGHEVHWLTSSPDHNRVDWEAGVWVHRLTGSLSAELQRLSGYRRLDRVWAVDVPVQDARWPTQWESTEDRHVA